MINDRITGSIWNGFCCLFGYVFFLCVFTYMIFKNCLKGTKTESEADRAYSSNANDRGCWARLKSGARDFLHISRTNSRHSNTGDITCCLPGRN